MSEELPLLELGPITDCYADGLHRIEILGATARLVFFKWSRNESKELQRVAVETAIIRPLTSFRFPIEQWPNVSIIKRSNAAIKLDS